MIFGLSFFALSYEGFKWLRSGGRAEGEKKISPRVLGLNADRHGAIAMQDENKDLLYLNEELDRENNRLLTEKQELELEIRKYEEAVKKIGQSEELMRRSNDALRKGYEKLAQEKEAMIMELSKKEWELRELSNTEVECKGKHSEAKPLLAAKSPAESKQRKAVEKLINEVDQMLFGETEKPAARPRSKKKVKGQ
jgi:chromosome segregation ATPase